LATLAITVLIGIVLTACFLSVFGVVWLAKQSGFGLLGLLILSFCAVADRQRSGRRQSTSLFWPKCAIWACL